MRIPLLIVLLLTAGVPVRAQTAPPTSLALRPSSRFAAPARPRPELEVRRRAAPAFAVELAGGAAGSLAGVLAGIFIANPDDCNNEDLACILQRLSVAGALSLVAAPAGTMLFGGLGDTGPNLPGAAIGSAAGVAAGVGLLKLSEEIDDDPIPILYGLVAYGLTHGLLTAIGSRIGAAL